MIITMLGSTFVKQPQTPNATPTGFSEDAILRGLLQYGSLTSQQLCRLLYSKGSLTYVQTKIKKLADASYCQRIFLPRATQRGSAPCVYTLARKGLNYLKDLGTDIPERYRPSEVRELSYWHLAHTLAVNDTLIAAELLSRRFSGIEIAAMLHERVLKRKPVRVEILTEGTNGTRREQIGVVPDAWLDFRLHLRDGTYQDAYAFEIDRGTEEQRKFRRKVAALVAFAKGPYQERFGTKVITIAVLATPGDKRRDELLRWTESELQRLGETQQADLFRFTSIDPSIVEPEQVFLTPHWRRPFDGRAYPLIDGVI